MIPQANIEDDILEDLEQREEPSLTYQLDMESYRITSYCDGIEAIKQAIYKILNTERYEYPIYSWDYGIELEELLGEPTSYVIPELERRITEALMQDERILEVSDFEFDMPKKNIITVTFLVETDLGTIQIEKEVEY